MESPDGKLSTELKEIPGKILLIDDEKYEMHLLGEAMNKMNWSVNVEYFSNAEDALEYMRQTKDSIFLIISDINLSKMSGIKFKKTIDTDPLLRKKAIPFIFISNAATMQQITEAYEYRVQGYFKKPMGIEEQAEMFDIILKYWIISRHPNKKEV